MEPESLTRVLWRQAKEGDQGAYERLFALHMDRLLVFVRARLGGAMREKVEPEDVLQDAWVAALNRFDQFEYTDDGAFLRWMCRIIDNRLRDANDYFRARKRQAIPLPLSAPTGPMTALQRAENRQRIEAALARLSDEHRDVILLRYFEGLTAEQAGERMNRSAGAIRSLSTRALVELGKLMGVQQESKP